MGAYWLVLTGTVSASQQVGWGHIIALSGSTVSSTGSALGVTAGTQFDVAVLSATKAIVVTNVATASCNVLTNTAGTLSIGSVVNLPGTQPKGVYPVSSTIAHVSGSSGGSFFVDCSGLNPVIGKSTGPFANGNAGAGPWKSVFGNVLNMNINGSAGYRPGKNPGVACISLLSLGRMSIADQEIGVSDSSAVSVNGALTYANAVVGAESYVAWVLSSIVPAYGGLIKLESAK